MQAAPQPSPATVWTTPASELESRTLTEFIARMNFENAAQCSPVTQAPPTYEQAVGRQVETFTLNVVVPGSAQRDFNKQIPQAVLHRRKWKTSENVVKKRSIS